MKHFCIISSHLYPIKSSTSSLYRDLIKYLLKFDIKITIITFSGINYKVKLFRTKKIQYICVKNKHLHSTNNFKRVYGDITSILKIFFFYKKKNFSTFDQLLVNSPSIFWSILLIKLKKKKVSIKLMDLYPKWLVDHKIISKWSFKFIFLKFFEIFFYIQSDKIFVQTKKDLDYLLPYKKLFKFDTEVVYNWINTEKLAKQLILKKKNYYVRFLFIGVLGKAQDPEILLNIIKYCKKKNYKSTFYFVGSSGTKRDDFRKQISEFKNVFFISELHLRKLDETIQKCDVCMSTLSRNFFSENFPGKILRYLINNKPMLVHSPNNNFLYNLIKKNSLGLFSSNEKELYENIDYIFLNYKSFEIMGNQGLNLIKTKFSTKIAANKLFNLNQTHKTNYYQ